MTDRFLNERRTLPATVRGLVAAVVVAGFVAPATVAVPSAPASAQQIVDNSVNASMLANRAKSQLRQHTSTTSPLDQKDRIRSARNSQIDNRGTSVHCGGIAIGNVQAHPSDHRSHNNTVFIHGSVVNTGNSC